MIKPYPGHEADADCYSRMLLSGIHNHKAIDSRLKHAGMTDRSRLLVNLQQPPIREQIITDDYSIYNQAR